MKMKIQKKIKRVIQCNKAATAVVFRTTHPLKAILKFNQYNLNHNKFNEYNSNRNILINY